MPIQHPSKKHSNLVYVSFSVTFSPTPVPIHETIVSSPCSYNVLVPRTTLTNRICPIATQLFTSDFIVYLHTLVHARLHYVITILLLHSAIEFLHPFHSTFLATSHLNIPTQAKVLCDKTISAFEFLRHIISF